MPMTRFRLRHDGGDVHDLRISLNRINDGIELLAEYESGTLRLSPGTTVARWPVTISLPAGSDSGHVWIGSGRIDIDVPELRGLGLGPLFMSLLIPWIQRHPNLIVVPITLSVDDARSQIERDRRNRFYERLGFTFDYEGDGAWGESKPIYSHDLRSPDRTSREGWHLEEL